MKENNHISFKGQTFFIGLDVHKKSWSVTVRHAGLNVKTFSMNPSPEELKCHLERNYPQGHYRSVYEAGFCGFWIHRKLVELGIDNIVIHASDVPTSHKEKVTKTDSIDSRKLARELANGTLRPLYIPQQGMEQLRSINRLYQQLVKESTRTKNRIKSHLDYYGAKPPGNLTNSSWSRAYLSWLDKLSNQEAPGAFCLRRLVMQVRHLEEEKEQIQAKLRSYIHEMGGTRRLNQLMSIPGIGFKTAVTLITEIMDMKRFKRLDDLCSYVGLVPSTRSSGEHDRTCGLTNRKNRHLKSLIIEASWIAARKDPALLEVWSKLSSKMKKSQAIIRIAKKILSRIRYVWLNDKEYQRCTSETI